LRGQLTSLRQLAMLLYLISVAIVATATCARYLGISWYATVDRPQSVRPRLRVVSEMMGFEGAIEPRSMLRSASHRSDRFPELNCRATCSRNLPTSCRPLLRSLAGLMLHVRWSIDRSHPIQRVHRVADNSAPRHVDQALVRRLPRAMPLVASRRPKLKLMSEMSLPLATCCSPKTDRVNAQLTPARSQCPFERADRRSPTGHHAHRQCEIRAMTAGVVLLPRAGRVWCRAGRRFAR
jgi:hypothetical protein